mmetsp:Transcript_7343/g.23447  ORF Transcript_7343/g.23447 Transcript_7343/m.23447 type:complete len:393 (+) Transcript_7343:100-1278(+)
MRGLCFCARARPNPIRFPPRLDPQSLPGPQSHALPAQPASPSGRGAICSCCLHSRRLWDASLGVSSPAIGLLLFRQGWLFRDGSEGPPEPPRRNATPSRRRCGAAAPGARPVAWRGASAPPHQGGAVIVRGVGGTDARAALITPRLYSAADSDPVSVSAPGLTSPGPRIEACGRYVDRIPATGCPFATRVSTPAYACAASAASRVRSGDTGTGPPASVTRAERQARRVSPACCALMPTVGGCSVVGSDRSTALAPNPSRGVAAPATMYASAVPRRDASAWSCAWYRRWRSWSRAAALRRYDWWSTGSSTMKTRASVWQAGRAEDGRVAIQWTSDEEWVPVMPAVAEPRWSSCAWMSDAARALPVGRGRRASSSHGALVGAGRAVRVRSNASK